MGDEMTDKDRIEAYSKLSEQMYKQYKDRRELEWRIHVAIWTFLVAIGYLVVTQHLQPKYSVFGLLLIIPLHAIWCIKIHIGEFLDQHHSIGYRRAAERLIAHRGTSIAPKQETLIDDEKPLLPPPEVQNIFDSYWWWVAVEAGTTALITMAIIVLAWQSNPIGK